MTWDAATDLDDVSFLQAVDWFAQRVPITDEEFTRDVEQARRQAFWIAGVTQAQVIRDVHRSLQRALDKGIPFEAWQAEIGPELERAWGGYLPNGEVQARRTELILRNWAQHSYSRARWKQMDEPVIRRLRPYRMFDAVRPTPDPTPVCTAWNGVVLPADHPAWETHKPPLHHGCQSGIRALTERKAKALGLTEHPPHEGPDEGWGTHEEWKGPDKRTFPREVKPPAPPPPPPPPKPGTAEFILKEKIAGPGGSNDGGIYRGFDGKERYVKFYDDPVQAQVEHLTNQIYEALRLGAPKSTLFEHNGKLAYASDLIPGVTELGKKLTPELAKKALDGFAADVLTANWDAAGLDLDNMVVDKLGDIIRIDNGGALLFRAQGGRKSLDQLVNVTEWEAFFNGAINPGYARLADAAGVRAAEELGDPLKSGIRKIRALEKRSGGWGAFVDKHVPDLPPHEKAKIVQALEARSRFLGEKLQELEAPRVKRITDEELRETAGHEAQAAERAKSYLKHHPYLGELKHYTLDGYAKTNALLRDPAGFARKFGPDRAQAVIEEARRVDQILQDAVASGHGLRGAVVRGERREDLPEAVWRAYQALRPGKEVVFSAFTSTSTSTSIAESFSGGVLMRIRQKSGVPVDRVSEVPGEREILLPSGRRFRVLHAEQRGATLLLELEEL